MTQKIEDLKENGFTVSQITTENLILRPGRLSDFDAVNSYAQMDDVCRFIRPSEGDEKTRKMLESFVQPWKFELGEWHGLIITLPELDQAIGDVVFRIDDLLTRRVEVGYRLSPTYASKGYITEATKAAVDMLFNALDITKIVARCDTRNIPSYKVMEKLGMKREAEFKAHYLNGNEFTDQYNYGILKSEWRINY